MSFSWNSLLDLCFTLITKSPGQANSSFEYNTVYNNLILQNS